MTPLTELGHLLATALDDVGAQLGRTTRRRLVDRLVELVQEAGLVVAHRQDGSPLTVAPSVTPAAHDGRVETVPTTTPRLDAFRAWRDAGCVGDLTWPQTPAQAAPRWRDDVDRLTEAIASCASGAPAVELRRCVLDMTTGRHVPAPPSQRKDHR